MTHELVLLKENSVLRGIADQIGFAVKLLRSTAQVTTCLQTGFGGVLVLESTEELAQYASVLNQSRYGCLLIKDQPVEEEPGIDHFEQSSAFPPNQIVRRIRGLVERIWGKGQTNGQGKPIVEDRNSLVNELAVSELAQKKLRKDHQQLCQAVREKEDLIQFLAHEVKTPISGIISMIQWFAESPMDEEQRAYLQALQSSGSGLFNLVNGLLDWAYLDSRSLKAEASLVDLDKMMIELKYSFAYLLKKKDLFFDVQLEGKMPRQILGDGPILRQILVNLISNGIKYTHTGGVTLKLKVRTEKSSSDQLQISVVDTGTGMTSAQLEHIFTPFWQAEKWGTKRSQGTGLGLALVQRMTQFLGSSLEVESEVGKGSQFTLNVPVAPKEGPDWTTKKRGVVSSMEAVSGRVPSDAQVLASSHSAEIPNKNPSLGAFNPVFSVCQ